MKSEGLISMFRRQKQKSRDERKRQGITFAPPNKNRRRPYRSTKKSKTLDEQTKTPKELKLLATHHFQKGSEALSIRNHLEAIHHYKSAATLFSKVPDPSKTSTSWTMASSCHFQLFDWRRVEISATCALEASQENVKARSLRARARFRLGDYGGVIRDIEVILKNGRRLSDDDLGELNKLLGVAEARRKIVEKTSLNYVNNHCDDDVSQRSSSSDTGNWWESAPFCPQTSVQNIYRLGEFRKKFGIIPPYDRMSLDCAFYEETNPKDLQVEFCEMILSQKFGKSQNHLDPLQFANCLNAFELSLPNLLHLQFGSERMKEEGPPRHPTDWHFDHYGTLIALVQAAFRSLPASQRKSAEVQRRLTEATLSGWEETPTEGIAVRDDTAWNGPEHDSIPESWMEGDGVILMQKAWDIWSSTPHARNLVIVAESHLSRGEGDKHSKRVIHACNAAFELDCLQDQVIRLASSDDTTGWDCVGDMLDVYIRIICCAVTAYLRLSKAKHALFVLNKTNGLPLQGANHICILIKKAEVCLQLGKLESVTECAKRAIIFIDFEREKAKHKHLENMIFGEKLEEAKELLSIANERQGVTRSPSSDSKGSSSIDTFSTFTMSTISNFTERLLDFEACIWGISTDDSIFRVNNDDSEAQ